MAASVHANARMHTRGNARVRIKQEASSRGSPAALQHRNNILQHRAALGQPRWAVEQPVIAERAPAQSGLWAWWAWWACAPTHCRRTPRRTRPCERRRSDRLARPIGAIACECGTSSVIGAEPSRAEPSRAERTRVDRRSSERAPRTRPVQTSESTRLVPPALSRPPTRPAASEPPLPSGNGRAAHAGAYSALLRHVLLQRGEGRACRPVGARAAENAVAPCVSVFARAHRRRGRQSRSRARRRRGGRLA